MHFTDDVSDWVLHQASNSCVWRVMVNSSFSADRYQLACLYLGLVTLLSGTCGTWQQACCSDLVVLETALEDW